MEAFSVAEGTPITGDLETTICPQAPDSEEETSVKSVADSSVRNQSLDHFVAMDSLISLEESFTKAVMQLENSHTYDTDRIIQCVELSKEACLQAISKINTTQMEGNGTASDKAKVRSLSEEIKLLEIKLKTERSKAEIATAQYEESLKHEKTMLSETRSELQKMIVSSNTEADFNAERLINFE